jgi:hypothetical protein
MLIILTALSLLSINHPDLWTQILLIYTLFKIYIASKKRISDNKSSIFIMTSNNAPVSISKLMIRKN